MESGGRKPHYFSECLVNLQIVDKVVIMVGKMATMIFFGKFPFVYLHSKVSRHTPNGRKYTVRRICHLGNLWCARILGIDFVSWFC